MEGRKSRRFSGRGFFSVLTGAACLALVVTGSLLFIVPPGRIANWTGWRLFGLTKDQWQTLHICFAILFVVGACAHIVYNWRPLVSYFKTATAGSFGFRADWVLACGVCVAVGIGAVAGVPPVSWLMNAHESIKHGWDAGPDEAPIPHAELLTLEELAAKTGTELGTLKANLEAGGIPVADTTVVIGDLAEKNGMTPSRLYSVALARGGCREHETGKAWGRGKKSSHGEGAETSGGEGRGFGRMTLAEYCTAEGVELTVAVEKLRAAGHEAAGSMTLWDIAGKAGIHPRDLRDVIKAK